MTQSAAGTGPDHYLVWLWFSLTALCVARVAYEQVGAGNGNKTLLQKLHSGGWVLYTLYTGPFGFMVYRLLLRLDPAHPAVWIRAGRATVHCAAGQMTGMLLAGLVSRWWGLSSAWELGFQYVAGLGVGLFLFKAADSPGGYARAVCANWFSETVAMNAMMAGMIPVMAFMTAWNMHAMQPDSSLYWGTTSWAFIAGSLTMYPPIFWLSNSGVAPPGSIRHLAPGKLSVLVLTLVALASAVAVASYQGFFREEEPMPMGAADVQPRWAVVARTAPYPRSVLVPAPS